MATFIPDESFTMEKVKEAADFIKSKISVEPKILIVCGSGMGEIADNIDDATKIPYSEIPNFPECSVPGHNGLLFVGNIKGVNVVCMQGRFHYYEGFSLQKLTMPIRVAKLLGVEYLITTNAAGGVNESYQVGDVMLVKDHINLLGLSGHHPLRGPNEDDFGPRFYTSTYDRGLIKKAKQVACSAGVSKYLHEGVLAVAGGPEYETLAEARYLRVIGADAIGMSVVPEVTVACHCGIKCIALSLITDTYSYDYGDEAENTNHEAVLAASKARAKPVAKFIAGIAGAIGKLIEEENARKQSCSSGDRGASKKSC